MQSGLLKDICQPLFSSCGINNFVYIEIDSNGKYTYLNSSPEYYEKIVESKLIDVFPERLINKEFSLGNHLSINRQGFVKELFYGELDSINTHFNMENFLFQTNVIKRNNNSSIQIVRFGGDANDKLLNNYYLNNLSTLTGFLKNVSFRMNLFLENADKLELNAKDKQSVVKRINTFIKSSDKSDKKNSLIIELPCAHADGRMNKIELTHKEQLIISLTLKGFTAKDIGKAIHHSPKTIEKYFSILKDKLDCKSKLHILGRLHEIGVLEAIYPS
jgi:DNA-binding CsgD family transcriptional regulator